MLLEYDENRLTTPPGAKPSTSALDHDRVVEAIAELKRDLAARSEASPLFGNCEGDAVEFREAQSTSIRLTEPSSSPLRPITTSRVLRSSPSRQSRS